MPKRVRGNGWGKVIGEEVIKKILREDKESDLVLRCNFLVTFYLKELQFKLSQKDKKRIRIEVIIYLIIQMVIIVANIKCG